MILPLSMAAAAAGHPLQQQPIPAHINPLPECVPMPGPLALAAARVRASALVSRPSLRGLVGTAVGLAVVAAFQSLRNGITGDDSTVSVSFDQRRRKVSFDQRRRGLALFGINQKALWSFVRLLAVVALEEVAWRVAALPHPSVDRASNIPTRVGSLAQVAFRIGINGVTFALYKSFLAQSLASSSVLAEITDTVPMAFSWRLDSTLVTTGIACAIAYLISGGAIYAPLLVRMISKILILGEEECTAAAVAATADRAGQRINSGGSSSTHRQFSDEELWVDHSIATSMPPAANLGIHIDHLDESGDGSLSLAMPLEGNTNIHGTAFAGSLYSVAGLCAWYTLVCYLRSRHLHERYAVVMKSASIDYRRPVRSPKVVARSTLPGGDVCDDFLIALESKGKSYLDVSGLIMQEGKIAVEYTAHLCAFRAQK